MYCVWSQVPATWLHSYRLLGATSANGVYSAWCVLAISIRMYFMPWRIAKRYQGRNDLSNSFCPFILMRQMSDQNFPAQVDDNSGHDNWVMIAWSAPCTITTSECGHNNFPRFHLVIAATGQLAGIRNLSLRVADKWCRNYFTFRRW